MNLNLGITLKKWRVSRGLTQKQVADAIGVSQFSVASYERGVFSPNEQIVARMSEFYGVDAGTLINNPPELTALQEASLGKYRRMKRVKDDGSYAERMTVKPPTDVDGLHESAAMRIKVAVCRGCQARGRGCDTCRLERYVKLCIDVVNGAVNLDDGLSRASTLAEDCIADANDRHDRESGFMQCGHGGLTPKGE